MLRRRELLEGIVSQAAGAALFSALLVGYGLLKSLDLSLLFRWTLMAFAEPIGVPLWVVVAFGAFLAPRVMRVGRGRWERWRRGAQEIAGPGRAFSTGEARSAPLDAPATSADSPLAPRSSIEVGSPTQDEEKLLYLFVGRDDTTLLDVDLHKTLNMSNLQFLGVKESLQRKRLVILHPSNLMMRRHATIELSAAGIAWAQERQPPSTSS
jgi:hypothetical protein